MKIVISIFLTVLFGLIMAFSTPLPLVGWVPSTSLALADTSDSVSPCYNSIAALRKSYATDKLTQEAFQAAYNGLQPLPEGYSYNGSSENPWKQVSIPKDGAGLAEAVADFYMDVCTLLPQILGTNDNALDSIQYFDWLYYRNEAARNMVAGVDPNNPSTPLDSVKDFLIQFNQEYKAFMDSGSSVKFIPEWIADPRLEIEDYQYSDPSKYQSWNDFFARKLKVNDRGIYPSRPVTMPKRDYVVVSPTDCIMNPLAQFRENSEPLAPQTIEKPLEPDTVLDVKGTPVSVIELLAGAPDNLKKKFYGGSGLACVLIPNTYHHFHSPVDGVIEYAEIVKAGSEDTHGTFGYDDWLNWDPVDAGQFKDFQRGVIIIRVSYENLPHKTPAKLSGYVASIPVGLATVGSIVFNENVKSGAVVTKGVTDLGNFYFGGSLNLLLFSPIEGTDSQMLSPTIQTRLGNQIGLLNTPYPAPPNPWAPDDTNRPAD